MTQEPIRESSLEEAVARALLERLLGTSSAQGHPDRASAIAAGKAAGIANPGALTKGGSGEGEWFYTDPEAEVPTGTFANEAEANAQAALINRPDLTPVFDTRTGRFRLSDAPGGLEVEWIPQVEKFVVTLPSGGSQLVNPPQSSGGGEITTTDIPGTDYVLFNDGQGNVQTVRKSDATKDNFRLGEVQIRGGQRFVETSPGNFQRLPDPDQTFEPGVVVSGGRQFVQSPTGNLTPLQPEATPSLNELVSQAILAGDAEAAIALADFRDRPTSMEAFNAAMQFAQSPGDVAAISAIARGQSLVTPPAAGNVHRIAEQPEFLRDAYTRLIANFRGGTGTPNDFVSIVERIANSERRAQEENLASQRQLAEEQRQRKDAEEKAFRDGLRAENAKLLAKLQADAAKASAGVSAPTGGVPSQAELASRATQSQLDFLSEFRNRSGNSEIFPSSPAVGAGSGVLPPTSGSASPPSVPGETQPGLNPAPQPPPAPAPAAPAPVPQLTREQALAQIQAEERGRPAPDPTIGTSEIDQLFEDDFFAGGGVFDDETAVVGEKGPELIVGGKGAQVIPLTDGELAKLRKKFNMREMAHGGTLGPLLPFGVRQALGGGGIEPTRRRLSTAAGLPVLSPQARRNLSPDEFDVFSRLSREAGISETDFLRELRSTIPGRGSTRPARFTPQVLR